MRQPLFVVPYTETKTLTWKRALIENLPAILAEALKIAAELNT